MTSGKSSGPRRTATAESGGESMTLILCQVPIDREGFCTWARASANASRLTGPGDAHQAREEVSRMHAARSASTSLTSSAWLRHNSGMATVTTTPEAHEAAERLPVV